MSFSMHQRAVLGFDELFSVEPSFQVNSPIYDHYFNASIIIFSREKFIRVRFNYRFFQSEKPIKNHTNRVVRREKNNFILVDVSIVFFQ